MAVAFYVLRGSGKRKNRRFALDADPMSGLGGGHARAIVNVLGDSCVAVTVARSQGETLKIKPGCALPKPGIGANGGG